MLKYLSLLLLGLLAFAGQANAQTATYYNGLYFDGGTSVPGSCTPPAFYYLASGGVTYACGSDKVFHAPGSGNLPSGTGLVVVNASVGAAVTLNGDGTLNTSTGAITVLKTNGNAFATSATTDTTNAANISSGTIPFARLPTFTNSNAGAVPGSGGGTTNFLRADGNWAAPPGGAPSGSAGGDLGGTYPNPSVTGIKTVPLCTGFTPSNGQVLSYSTGLSPNPCYTAVPQTGGSNPFTTNNSYTYTSGTLTIDASTYTLMTVTPSAGGVNPTITITAPTSNLSTPIEVKLCNFASGTAATWTFTNAINMGAPIRAGECVTQNINYNSTTTQFEGQGSTATPSILDLSSERAAPTVVLAGGAIYPNSTGHNLHFLNSSSVDFAAFATGHDCAPDTGICTKTNGVAFTAPATAATTGSGNVVLATSPTITTPTIAGATETGTITALGATHTAPSQGGLTASKPGTCTVGDTYLATDATAGQNWFFCTATNTWTQQLNSGGGGGGVGGSSTASFTSVSSVTVSGVGIQGVSVSCIDTSLNGIGFSWSVGASPPYNVAITFGGLTVSGSCTILGGGAASTADLGAICSWSNTGTCTFAASGAFAAGTLTTVASQAMTLSESGLVKWGTYNLEINNGSGAAATLTLGTGGSCSAWKVAGGGGGAITLTGSSAIDLLSFTFDGTNCVAWLSNNHN